MIKVNFKIGRQSMQAEFETMRDVHKHNTVYGKLPQKCTAIKDENGYPCGSDDIYIDHQEFNGNEYWRLACGTCGASANFGIHKQGGSLFWKNDPMTVYVKPEGDL